MWRWWITLWSFKITWKIMFLKNHCYFCILYPFKSHGPVNLIPVWPTYFTQNKLEFQTLKDWPVPMVTWGYIVAGFSSTDRWCEFPLKHLLSYRTEKIEWRSNKNSLRKWKNYSWMLLGRAATGKRLEEPFFWKGFTVLLLDFKGRESSFFLSFFFIIFRGKWYGIKLGFIS